ncbi:GTPase IMAP family member 8 Immune-associated nucleotide-binding protein 9 [Channa argus]|uniref:GTPase IMAP family member 8 Immune-associated nucleotide-binding protein 9 n=1 Tax=Channa argus TaxID=215402 RepID=A0A6G1PS56_CHAAH|nr:GTPase IMAP family member 8 Immune-associated nucleotide-binding protein 9 [Channa argus]
MGFNKCFSGRELSLSPVAVLLLGEKLSGKSSAGNTILGKQAFNKKTTHSSKENGTVFGKQVTVVDTPGWLSHSATPDRVSQELSRGLTFSQSERQVILLVLPITTTFGQVEWKAMEVQLRLLQTPIWQQAIVLFTHGDKLGSLSIHEHIRQQSRTLHWLLERCGNRYQIMSNQSRDSQAQVTELFEKIHRMMLANERSREIQYRMYTKLRQDVCMKEERRGRDRQEEIEMTGMHDVQDGRQRKQIFSGWLNLPRTAAGLIDYKPDLGLILLGRRKSGKSTAGNMILDKEEFQTDTKTTRCSQGHGTMSGWSVTVVDTPGWSLFGLANPEQVKREISQSLSLLPVRSKAAFLLVIPVDSFREKDRRAVEMYLSVLGGKVWGSAVVVFTYGEELRGKTVEKHIETMGKPLQWVLDRCGQRHCVFRNERDKTEVTQLLEMVKQL